MERGTRSNFNQILDQTQTCPVCCKIVIKNYHSKFTHFALILKFSTSCLNPFPPLLCAKELHHQYPHKISLTRGQDARPCKVCDPLKRTRCSPCCRFVLHNVDPLPCGRWNISRFANLFHWVRNKLLVPGERARWLGWANGPKDLGRV